MRQVILVLVSFALLGGAIIYASAVASSTHASSATLAADLMQMVMEDEAMREPDYSTTFVHDGDTHVVATYCNDALKPAETECARWHLSRVEALKDALAEG